MTENGFEEYDLIPEPTACPLCQKEADNGPYSIAKMEPGKNAAPIHPHCHCAVAPYVDREKVWRDIDKMMKGEQVQEQEDVRESDMKKFKRQQHLPNQYDGLSSKRDYTNKRNEYIRVTREKFSQGTKLGQRLFTKYADQSAVETLSEMGKIRYEDGKLYLNMYRDVHDNRGAGTGYFHEFGHQIDDKLNWRFTKDRKIANLLNWILKNYKISQF